MSSLRKKVIEMEVGELIVVPMTENPYTTIRAYASELGFQLDRKYTTKRDREARVYTITRVA